MLWLKKLLKLRLKPKYMLLLAIILTNIINKINAKYLLLKPRLISNFK